MITESRHSLETIGRNDLTPIRNYLSQFRTLDTVNFRAFGAFDWFFVGLFMDNHGVRQEYDRLNGKDGDNRGLPLTEFLKFYETIYLEYFEMGTKNFIAAQDVLRMDPLYGIGQELLGQITQNAVVHYRVTLKDGIFFV